MRIWEVATFCGDGVLYGDPDWPSYSYWLAPEKAEPVAYLHRYKPGGRPDEVSFDVAPNKLWTSEPLYT